MTILIPVARVLSRNARAHVKSDGSGVDMAGMQTEINPFDEIALEKALQLREAGKVSGDIVAVMVGPKGTQDTLRTALAMGADRGIHIVVPEGETVQPPDIARMLAKIAGDEKPDFVMMGKQTTDGENGQTGQMLAAMMGWPQATAAAGIEIADGRAQVTRETDSGLQIIDIGMPAVVTADLRFIDGDPRKISLPNIMKSKKKPIDEKAPADYGVELAPRVKTLRVAEPPKRTGGIKVGSVGELIEKLGKAGIIDVGAGTSAAADNSHAPVPSTGNTSPVLVIAEHDNESLKSATLNAVSAAAKIGGPVKILVAGHNCAAVAEAAGKIPGVTEVLHADDPAYAHVLAESMAALIAKLAPGNGYVLAPATGNAKNFLPRAAALSGVGQISDIIDVVDANTFKRSVYAGAGIATVQSDEPIKFATVRMTAFDAAPAIGGAAPVVKIDGAGDSGLSKFVSEKPSPQTGRPELPAAGAVISGGRGLASGENFKKLVEPLADALGSVLTSSKGVAIGASRAAVDSGFVPNDYQVGQTGKVVAPQLYVAIGISGAIQHLAGMKDSKVIVAINKDPDAPIFELADFGIVGDLFQIVPDLTAALKALGPLAPAPSSGANSPANALK